MQTARAHQLASQQIDWLASLPGRPSQDPSISLAPICTFERTEICSANQLANGRRLAFPWLANSLAWPADR